MNSDLYNNTQRSQAPTEAATAILEALAVHPIANSPKVITQCLYGMGEHTARVQVVFELTVKKGSKVYPQRFDL